MANRNRTHPVQFYLSDDEQYILNTKFKASGMPFHVPIILSVHISLGLCYSPVSLDVPVTQHGRS